MRTVKQGMGYRVDYDEALDQLEVIRDSSEKPVVWQPFERGLVLGYTQEDADKLTLLLTEAEDEEGWTRPSPCSVRLTDASKRPQFTAAETMEIMYQIDLMLFNMLRHGHSNLIEQMEPQDRPLTIQEAADKLAESVELSILHINPRWLEMSHHLENYKQAKKFGV